MNRSTIQTLILLIAVSILLGGCMHARPLEQARIDIERQLPGAEFEPEFKITLGRLAMSIVRQVADDEDTEVLRNIRKVQLAVYRTVSLPDQGHVGLAVQKATMRKGWQLITDIQSPDSSVQVLARMKENRVQDLMLAVVEEEDMVLIRLYGDVHTLLNNMIEEEGLNVPGVVTADLKPEPGTSAAVVTATQP